MGVRKHGIMGLLVAVLVLAGCLQHLAQGSSEKGKVPRITKEEIKGMLGNPEVIVIDVRSPNDWEGSNSKIKGAIREDPGKPESWADKYGKDKTLVFY